MRRGFPLLAAGLLAFLPGCLAVEATTKAAKVVGKGSVAVVKTTAKVITWPVREAVKMSKASQTPVKEPETVVVHGDASTKSTRTASKSDEGRVKIDGGIKLASADKEEEESETEADPPPRRTRKTAARAPKEESEDAELDDPPPSRRRSKSTESTDEESQDLDLPPASTKSKEKANWRGKTPTRSASAASSDPDTIRIE